MRYVLPVLLLIPGLISAQVQPPASQVRGTWIVDTAPPDPMTDKQVVKATIQSTRGADMGMGVVCTPDARIFMFVVGATPITQYELVPLTELYRVQIRVRFDKSAVVDGAATYVSSQPSMLGFPDAPIGDLAFLMAANVAPRLATSHLLWIEYPTSEGRTTSGFDLPINTASVVSDVYSSCNLQLPGNH
jgi:hypothetical protein